MKYQPLQIVKTIQKRNSEATVGFIWILILTYQRFRVPLKMYDKFRSLFTYLKS